MQDDRIIKIKKQRAYAEAILKNAIAIDGKKEVLRVREDLKYVLLAGSKNAEMLSSVDKWNCNNSKEPCKNIDSEKFIRSSFKGISEAALKVFVIMCDNADVSLLPNMFYIYNDLVEEVYDVVLVDITTVVELDDNLRKLITNKLQNDLDSKVVLHEHIDKSILAGIVISAQGRTLDASFKSMFYKSEKQLSSIHAAST